MLTKVAGIHCPCSVTVPAVVSKNTNINLKETQASIHSMYSFQILQNSREKLKTHQEEMAESIKSCMLDKTFKKSNTFWKFLTNLYLKILCSSARRPPEGYYVSYVSLQGVVTVVTWFRHDTSQTRSQQRHLTCAHLALRRLKREALNENSNVNPINRILKTDILLQINRKIF